MEGFFDAYPRFYETGNTPGGVRLSARYECLIEGQLDLIRDKRILDIGSHDGRWSFAALQAGARHVTAIEPRAELVSAAREVFDLYGIERDRVTFHVGDARDVLREAQLQVDTVFLFGVLYHVHYHVDLIAAAHAAGASAVIVDTEVVRPEDARPDDPLVRLRAEAMEHISQGATPAFAGASRAIVGVPTKSAVAFLLREYEFEPREVSWQPYLDRWLPYSDEADVTGLKDYAGDRRATFVGERKS